MSDQLAKHIKTAKLKRNDVKQFFKIFYIIKNSNFLQESKMIDKEKRAKYIVHHKQESIMKWTIHDYHAYDLFLGVHEDIQTWQERISMYKNG